MLIFVILAGPLSFRFAIVASCACAQMMRVTAGAFNEQEKQIVCAIAQMMRGVMVV